MSSINSNNGVTQNQFTKDYQNTQQDMSKMQGNLKSLNDDKFQLSQDKGKGADTTGDLQKLHDDVASYSQTLQSANVGYQNMNTDAKADSGLNNVQGQNIGQNENSIAAFSGAQMKDLNHAFQNSYNQAGEANSGGQYKGFNAGQNLGDAIEGSYANQDDKNKATDDINNAFLGNNSGMVGITDAGQQSDTGGKMPPAHGFDDAINGTFGANQTATPGTTHAPSLEDVVGNRADSANQISQQNQDGSFVGKAATTNGTQDAAIKGVLNTPVGNPNII